MMTRQTVGIIGMGRFGQLWAKILANDFTVVFFDSDKKWLNSKGYCELADLVEQSSTIFIASPIHTIASVLQALSQYTLTGKTVMDLCSVKVYPCQLMQQYLPDDVDIIAAHPMFGPDSYSVDPEHKLVIHSLINRNDSYQPWRHYFQSLGWKLLEMTPDEHDRQAAFSQGLTHFLGRVLGQIELRPEKVATLGYRKLLELVDQTCHDSEQLFVDLMRYNPYSQDMIDTLLDSVDTIKQRCFTKQQPIKQLQQGDQDGC